MGHASHQCFLSAYCQVQQSWPSSGSPTQHAVQAFTEWPVANSLCQMGRCALCRYGVAGFVATIVFGMWLLPKDTGSRPREDLLLAVSIGPSSGSSVSSCHWSYRPHNSNIKPQPHVVAVRNDAASPCFTNQSK